MPIENITTGDEDIAVNIMAQHQSLRFDHFDPKIEDISNWLERLEAAMHNVIPEEDKIHKLVAVIGPIGYAALKELAHPQTTNNITYETAERLLTRHFQPKRVMVAERAKFDRRNQLPGESLQEYVLALKRLASTCKFSEVTDPLEERLRDRFIAGMKSARLRERLTESTQNWQATYERALTLEAAHANSNNSQIAEHSVLAVHSQGPSRHHGRQAAGTAGTASNRPHPQRAGGGESKQTLDCAGCGGNHARRHCQYKMD